MSFTFPSLFWTWLLPLVALPVLIHLINLLRHRRVKWAAMEFLLESRKKERPIPRVEPAPRAFRHRDEQPVQLRT